MKSKLFIKHDMYALDDDLIEALVDEFKESGYGIWWAIIERLTIADTHALRLEELVRKVDKALTVKRKSITEKVIKRCVELGLLVEENGYIYNERVCRQCFEIDEISRKNAENVKIRWENAKKQQAQYEGNTVVLEGNNAPNTDKDKDIEKDRDRDKDKKNECSDFVAETFKAVCAEKFNPIRTLSDTRKSHCLALVEKFGKEAVKEGFERASKSSFLTGSNGWKATFDWLILPSNFLKVLEGNYDDKSPVKALPKSSVCSAGAFNGQKNAEGGFDL